MSHRRMRCSGCGKATEDYSPEQLTKADATTRKCKACESSPAPTNTENQQQQQHQSQNAVIITPLRQQEEARAIRLLMSTAFTPTTERLALLRRILAIKTLHPENRAIKHFDWDYFHSLTPQDQEQLLWIINSGVHAPESSVGCYAMHCDDYSKFSPFFSKVIADYHKVDITEKHKTDWSLKGVANLPADGQLDLAKLGLPALSMRVRVGRNLSEFPLPGSMTQQDRVNLELKMNQAFKILIADPKFGGRYYSLTPGHPDEVSAEEYEHLVKSHLMFKDMSKDEFLVTAGIARHWPYGRGCFVSADRQIVVWVGEEDHLRIMCLKRGTLLNEVFDRLRFVLLTIESLPGVHFATSQGLGYVTSCPSNLGTGMRASVHIALPHLCRDGTERKANVVCKPLGLSVRGLGGEHTPIGKDGTVDISPSARCFITEAQIIAHLYEGLCLLQEKERQEALAN